MSFGTKIKPTEVVPDPLTDEEFSGAQQAVPVPFLAGERLIPLHWFTGIYDQQWIEAPEERPAKK